MIPNQWYVILESKQLKQKPVSALRLGEKMAVWRDASGKSNVISDKCPHRGASLSQGKSVGDCLQCPFHGFEFDATGKCSFIPANGMTAAPPKAMKTIAYPTREAYGFIWVWWGEQRDEYPEIPWFDDLRGDDFEYSSTYASWPVHYSRCIENQLDVIHLPFVHASTIGRGNKAVVDGPITKMNGQEMHIWVHNRHENGIPSLRADDIPKPDRPPQLKFLFPNIWMNNISKDFRITINFIPIDEGNTLFCMRNYMRKNSIPGAAKLFSWLAIPSARVILKQDERVVVNQLPIKSDLKIGEILIPQDGPIILYRRHRQQLIEFSKIT
jgi:phenylpropionate dioxygenase-like ring-hydroxylating dioxygenase large terminal subunit